MCQIKKRVMNYLVPEHFDRTHINGIRNLIEYSDALDQLNKCVLPVDDYNLHATLSDIINKLKPGFIIMRTQNQIQHKLRTINQSLLHKTILSSMPKPTRHHANDDKYYLSKNSLFVVTSFLSGRSSHHFFGHQKQFRLRGGFGLILQICSFNSVFKPELVSRLYCVLAFAPCILRIRKPLATLNHVTPSYHMVIRIYVQPRTVDQARRTKPFKHSLKSSYSKQNSKY